MDAVKKQYEKFPYPPVSFLALPHADQGKALRYEFGGELLQKSLGISSPQNHDGKTILVAGCGTLEALVVAQMHPKAKEIVAVDFSGHSLAILKRRIRFAKFSRFLFFYKMLPKLPPIRLVQADLHTWEGGEFDYILANNMIHHVADPEKLFIRIAGWLKPGGLFRLVTYPKQSRIWMRATAEYFRREGLSLETPNLRPKAHAAILKLSADHPIRNCYLAQPETRTDAGLVDAFFHACEKPLGPLQWKLISEQAGLNWLGEAQRESSQSSFLDELVPQTKSLPAWTKLQILDDLLEICDNPVIWFSKNQTRPGKVIPHLDFMDVDFSDGDLDERCRLQLQKGLQRIETLLAGTNVTTEKILGVLKEEVGPRTLPGREEKPLANLTIWEHF